MNFHVESEEKHTLIGDVFTVRSLKVTQLLKAVSCKIPFPPAYKAINPASLFSLGSITTFPIEYSVLH